ncbi:HpaII family restriction endonuclease [Thermophagus sp. OGC60D27]|uniref:HpaII family restriction endonuclease n=1 Tax=Thermophagus sp. OGC60D27 TaxID=3458415 RepID=UPI004037BECE
MIKGNKGEWSEIYTLLKIISDKQLYAGDSYLNKIENLIFPIVRILREKNSNGLLEFTYADDCDLVIVNDSSGEEFRIQICDFRDMASLLLSKLKEKTSSSFSVPEIENFITSFSCSSLKAKSSVKSDIRIVIHDLRTGTTPELGFSIKSQLGGASTLLNPGKTTNFIYKIENTELTESQIKEINSIDSKRKIKERIKKIEGYSGELRFFKTENSVFGGNLTLIDSSLPRIMAEIVYLFFASDYSKTVDLVKELSRINPIEYSDESNHPFYSYKIKRLLTEVALGMVPSKVWTGELDATGGYLVVKDDGEILCYHIYNRNEFEEYLFNNTKLDTASSTRYDFGTVYKEGNQEYFKLNLQIRFIK